MPFVQSFIGITVQDEVTPTVGPYKGIILRVISIETEAGASSGWFTCALPKSGAYASDESLLFAGEEIVRIGLKR